MCCFSRPVDSVSATSIFARSALNGRQYIVYSMTLDARENLAMVLPLPVKQGTGETDVEFNLKEYSHFFSDLEMGFPAPPCRGTKSAIEAPSADSLPVIDVGDFQASFVPTVKDFSRLDERFRLPAGTWEKLPQYKNYGFAVFKLKPGSKTIHPMAFSFSRADLTKLFFPTVHIHDGKVHEKAEFDHVLYAQPRPGEPIDLSSWEESKSSAETFMNIKKAQGIVSGPEHCNQKSFSGNLANTDIWIEKMS